MPRIYLSTKLEEAQNSGASKESKIQFIKSLLSCPFNYIFNIRLVFWVKYLHSFFPLSAAEAPAAVMRSGRTRESWPLARSFKKFGDARRWKFRQFGYRQGFSDQTLNRADFPLFSGHGKRNRVSGSAGASRAADSMHVIVRG